MKELSHFFITVAAVLTAEIFISIAKDSEQPQIKAEYQLEILNQDSVKVESLSTGRIYVVPFDEVGTVLLKDNL